MKKIYKYILVILLIALLSVLGIWQYIIYCGEASKLSQIIFNYSCDCYHQLPPNQSYNESIKIFKDKINELDKEISKTIHAIPFYNPESVEKYFSEIQTFSFSNDVKISGEDDFEGEKRVFKELFLNIQMTGEKENIEKVLSFINESRHVYYWKTICYEKDEFNKVKQVDATIVFFAYNPFPTLTSSTKFKNYKVKSLLPPFSYFINQKIQRFKEVQYSIINDEHFRYKLNLCREIGYRLILLAFVEVIENNPDKTKYTYENVKCNVTDKE